MAESSLLVDVTKVEFRLSGPDDDALVGIADRTIFGWVYEWDTTSVANGTYTVNSVALDIAGRSGRSEGVTITVDN